MLAPQTADTLLERVFEAVRLVQVSVVGGRDVGVLAVVAGDRCWVALVEHALTFLLLVLRSQRGGVLHLDRTIVVDLVGAECAVKLERTALASQIIWVIVLYSRISKKMQRESLVWTTVPFQTTACIQDHR